MFQGIMDLVVPSLAGWTFSLTKAVMTQGFMFFWRAVHLLGMISTVSDIGADLISRGMRSATAQRLASFLLDLRMTVQLDVHEEQVQKLLECRAFRETVSPHFWGVHWPMLAGVLPVRDSTFAIHDFSLFSPFLQHQKMFMLHQTTS